jgi:hypothetical protein
MMKFLAVYIGSENSPKAKEWETLSEEEGEKREKQGIAAWKEWAMKHQKSIIDLGGPLGPTKQVDAKGISKTKNALTAYTVIQAESHEDAAKLFLNHPHFTIFPGDSVEIIECFEIPGL